MRDGDAEPKRTHRRRVLDDCLDLTQDVVHAHVVAGQEVRQLLRGVGTSAPGQCGKVDVLTDAEVLERAEESLVERIPQAHLERCPVIEPAADIDPVAALRGCGHAKQQPRRDAFEKPLVRLRLGVVELVHDDDIETRQILVAHGVPRERLDRGEHMPPLRRLLAIDEQLAERCVVEHRTKRRHALPQDLLTVCDEQQCRRPIEALVKVVESAVVERCDDGLARAGWRDNEVAPTVVTQSLSRERLKDLRLVRPGDHLQTRQNRRVDTGASTLCPDGCVKARCVTLRVVGLELRVGPVGIEALRHLAHEIGCVLARKAHVPLEPIH